MKAIQLFRIAIFFALIVSGFKSYSQSASGVGLGYGPSKPFSNDYNFGSGVQLFGNLAIADKWEIVPSLGLESINSKGRTYQADPYNIKRIGNVTLIYISASGKYDFSRQFFVKAGPTLYVGAGGDDVAAAGIGGMAAGGYNWDLDEHSTLELSLFTTVIDIETTGRGVTPIAGFKVAYVFNFSHGKLKPPPGRPPGF